MELGPILGFDNLARDLETGAILNLDTNTALGLKLAKEKKRKEKEQLEKNTSDINSIKSEVSEIKTMLKILIEGKNNG
tara:strand:+ start:1307 stop:1540 length:234 start_codon:yes stop_codon:yes gene_type:complete